MMIPETEESGRARWRNLQEDLKNLREQERITIDTPFRHYVRRDIEEVLEKLREMLEEYPFLDTSRG